MAEKSAKKIVSRDVAIKQLKKIQDGVKVSNPFDPFHDIFEEDKEADKFLCDPMFWRHFECIDSKRAMQRGTIEFRSLRLMFWEAVIYTFFMLLFTVYAYSMQSPELIAVRTMQRNYWGGCTEDDCRFKLVQDQSSFWNWVENDFVKLAYTPSAQYDHPIARLDTTFPHNGFKISWSPRYITDETNILIGSIRVRQVRVRGNKDGGLGCIPSAMYRHLFTECFPGFDVTNEDRNPYYGDYTPSYTRPCFTWRDGAESLAVPITGNASTYSASGYFFDMPLHRREASILLRDLREWGWLDQQTRAVIFELNVLNTNVNTLANTRLLIEFTPSGLVVPVHSIQVWPLETLTFSTTGNALLILLLMALSIIALAVATCYVLWQIVFRCRLKFFTYSWNIVDLLILALIYVYLAIRSSVYSRISAEPNLASHKVGHPEVFHPFSRAALDGTMAAPKILSVTLLLLWIRFNKYLTLCGHFRPFLRLFHRCFKELSVLSIMVVVLFFGFSVAFFIGFGDEQEIFSKLEDSSLVLYFFLLGGFRVNYQDWFSPADGDSARPLLFLLFFFLLYFVCFNIFMAIVLDAYTMVQIFHDESKYLSDDAKNPMTSFLLAYYHLWKGITLVDAKDGEAENPELHSIRLILLPSLVAKKWVDKRKRLHTILYNTEDVDEHGDTVSHASRLKTQAAEKILPATAIQMMKAGRLPKKKKDSSDLYRVARDPNMEITATQLQRLLDEDHTIRLLLGMDKAVDVIQRFKCKTGPDSEIDILQSNVFKKLDTIEKAGLNFECRVVPQVRDISNKLDLLYSEIQSNWRAELTSVLELTSMLSEGLITFTKNLDQIADNHDQVLDAIGGPSEQAVSEEEESMETSSSGSSSV